MIEGYKKFLTDQEAYEVFKENVVAKWYLSFFKDGKLDNFICGGYGLETLDSAIEFCREQMGEDIELVQVFDIKLSSFISERGLKSQE